DSWVCLTRQTVVFLATPPVRQLSRTSSSPLTSIQVAPLLTRPHLRTIPVRCKFCRSASQQPTTIQTLTAALASSLSLTIPAARPALLLLSGFLGIAIPPNSP